MVVVALLSIDLVESVDLVFVDLVFVDLVFLDLVVNCMGISNSNRNFAFILVLDRF